MGQCHCLGNHSTDEAEDALLRNFEEQQQRPIGPPPPYQQVPLSFYMLTEEQRLHIISRITLIQSLPTGRYECHKTRPGKFGEKVEKLCLEKPGAAAAAATAMVATATCVGEEKAAAAAAACPEKADLGEKTENRECPICMNDFVSGDPIRLLPCMHYYHLRCIDDWLMRSLTCPTCMQRVDLAMRSASHVTQPAHLVSVPVGTSVQSQSRSASSRSNGANSGASSAEQLAPACSSPLVTTRIPATPPTSPLRLIAEVSHH